MLIEVTTPCALQEIPNHGAVVEQGSAPYATVPQLYPLLIRTPKLAALRSLSAVHVFVPALPVKMAGVQAHGVQTVDTHHSLVPVQSEFWLQDCC